MVKAAWYDTEVALVQALTASSTDTRAKVSDTSLLKTGWTIEIVSDHGPIPERMTILDLVGQCDEAADDDSDGAVNDGCPMVDDGLPRPETGDQCANAVDDDGDGKVNDGCPAFDDGVLHPETGTQCNFNYDDDADGYINDGCPAVDAGGTPHPETGAECNNIIDEDEDGYFNDGCPAVDAPETGDQCKAANDDDGDGYINDGCPATVRAESSSECYNDDDDDSDGKVNDGCPTWDPSNEGEPGSECTNMLDDDSDAKVNDGCPQVGATSESGTQCDNIFDNDGDGVANDGCPQVGAAEETNRCANAVDDDADGYVNDGCAEYHALTETGTQCTNSTDDDGDTVVNDGCPNVGAAAETTTRDTMVVQRASGGGGPRDSHSVGAPIRDHIVKEDIWVKDIPSTHVYGVGGLQLYVRFDPTELEYVKSTLDLSWLTSTGRSAWYTGPTLEGGNTIHANFSTSGDPQNPPWPKGPTGSGKIATVWFRVLSPDSLVSRRSTLTGTRVYDLNTAEITSLAQYATVKTVRCPDANLDGTIECLDGTIMRTHLNDGGSPSGATLAAGIDKDQTTIPISGQGSLAVGQIVAVDNEHMRITGVDTGPPLTMTVERGIYTQYTPTNVPHSAGTAIFIADSDGNYDGRFGYTHPRDTNEDFMINGLDAIPVYGVLGIACTQ